MFGILRSAPDLFTQKKIGISAMVGGLKGSYPKHYTKTFLSTKYFPVDATPGPDLSQESSPPSAKSSRCDFFQE